jgi:hypothetical protein
MDDKDFFSSIRYHKARFLPIVLLMHTSNERQPQLLEEDAMMKVYIHSFFFLLQISSPLYFHFFLKRTHPSPYLTSICNVMRFTNFGDVLHMYSCLIDSVGLIDFEIWTIKVLGISKISSLMTIVYHMMHWEAATRNGLLLKFELC